MAIRKQPSLLENPAYDPEKLLESLSAHLNCKSDAAVARALHLTPPAISKIRHRKIPVTDFLLIRMHDVTSVPITNLRLWMGITTNSLSS